MPEPAELNHKLSNKRPTQRPATEAGERDQTITTTTTTTASS